MEETEVVGGVRVVREMPAQKPGKSRQDYGTPPALIVAVARRFGPIVHDLAATPVNAKARSFYTEQDDAFTKDWAGEHPIGNLWLNPPFSNIGPWAERCKTQSDGRLGYILFLVPASVGSNWFMDHVHNHALVLALSPRLTFEGETAPYPKDCILAVYGMGLKGFDVWRWNG